MNKKQIICDYIEKNKERFIGVSDKIWGYAELGFEERQSAQLLCSELSREGFTIQTGIAGIETAFVASYGSGSPVIAILAEYDALSGLSQERAIPVKKALSKGASGHGCGHNVLGAGSMAAALAVKEYLIRTGTKGTVRLYGCPGEEYGAGKTFMVREGCFEGADIALCWHPSDTTSIWGVSSLANISVYFRFTGKASHASATPFLGRSALDAVELMDIGANYLREHIIPEARLHYAITDAGGSSPNVVQPQAEVHYFIRSPKVPQAQEIYGRLCDVAKGAALMTGTVCEILFDEALSDYIPNKTVGKVLYQNLLEAGPPAFDEQDYALAEAFRSTFDVACIQSSIAQIGYFQGAETANKMAGRALWDGIGTFFHIDAPIPGSTDVGDVSYVVPTAQIVVAASALSTPSHSWQNTAQMSSPIAYKALVTAAKALGMAAADFFQNPQTVEEAKRELFAKTHGEYICPIPANVRPNAIKG